MTYIHEYYLTQQAIKMYTVELVNKARPREYKKWTLFGGDLCSDAKGTYHAWLDLVTKVILRLKLTN